MSKVCAFVAQGLEECEALVTVDILRHSGAQVTMAAVGGEKRVVGSHGIAFEADALAEEVNLEEYDMVFLPGGMPGTKNLEASPLVCAGIKSFAAAGKKVAAICAAPSVLGHLGLLEGKEAVCYPGFEKELTGARVLYTETVTDGNITTGRGLGAAVPFALALVKTLYGPEKARTLAEQIIWMHP